MQKLLLLLFFLSTLFALPQYSKTQKQKYLYPLGEKIYKKRCSNIDLKGFDSIDELYEHIEKNCSLEEKRYNVALAYYLWDGVKKTHSDHIRFSYTKKDRCAVCGMFVYKYPKWVAMIVQKGDKRLYFDGVKDMMKYYFSHNRADIEGMFAQDYYSKKVFDIQKGYFVIGSDIYGPMGEELIPFKRLKSAKKFMIEHKGKRIYSFDQLLRNVVEALDE